MLDIIVLTVIFVCVGLLISKMIDRAVGEDPKPITIRQIYVNPTIGTWRVGRKLGRTIYLQTGSQPSDHDIFLGMMDTSAIAEHIVDLHNNQERIIRTKTDFTRPTRMKYGDK